MSVKGKYRAVKRFSGEDWGVIAAAWFGFSGMLLGLYTFGGGIEPLTQFQSYLLGSVWLLATPVVFILMVESITGGGE